MRTPLPPSGRLPLRAVLHNRSQDCGLIAIGAEIGAIMAPGIGMLDEQAFSNSAGFGNRGRTLVKLVLQLGTSTASTCFPNNKPLLFLFMRGGVICPDILGDGGLDLAIRGASTPPSFNLTWSFLSHIDARRSAQLEDAPTLGWCLLHLASIGSSSSPALLKLA